MKTALIIGLIWLLSAGACFAIACGGSILDKRNRRGSE